MANIGGSHTDEFGAGIDHLTNPGRANVSSITLGGSLQADSDRWNGMSPHSVLGTTVGAGSDDNAYERLGRDDGSYQPGQMPELSDQITSGTNDNTP